MATSRTRRGGTNIISGSIGGLAGAIVMIPFFILTAVMAGMPLLAMPAGIGLMFGATADSAIAVGLVMHLVAGVLIGMIFGAVTAVVGRLGITSHRKGVGEGLVAGMVAFVVLAMPMTMISGGQAGQNAAAMLAVAIAEHLAYGAVLGAVTAALVLGAEKRRARAVAEGMFTCSSCQMAFSNPRDLDEHVRSMHHGVAA